MIIEAPTQCVAKRGIGVGTPGSAGANVADSYQSMHKWTEFANAERCSRPEKKIAFTEISVCCLRWARW